MIRLPILYFPQSHEADFPIKEDDKFLYYDVKYKISDITTKTIGVRKYGAIWIYDNGFKKYMENESKVISIKLIGSGK